MEVLALIYYKITFSHKAKRLETIFMSIYMLIALKPIIA